MAKCLLRVTGQEAKAACRTEQLAGGVKYGIEGGIHKVRLLWQQHSQEEDWGFLLIDARNALNEDNHIEMLWNVRHKWTSGAQFTFNCYLHWDTLVVRDTEDGSGKFWHSKEGVTQEDPLAMISYGIGVLLLIIELWGAHPCVTETWYADDVGAGGKFGHILEHFQDLQARGTLRGYFLDPTKSILVVTPSNVTRV